MIKRKNRGSTRRFSSGLKVCTAKDSACRSEVSRRHCTRSFKKSCQVIAMSLSNQHGIKADLTSS